MARKVINPKVPAEKRTFKPPARIDQSYLYKLTEHFVEPARATGQLIENAADWGAKKTLVRYTMKDGMVHKEVLDNGSGASEEGLSAIVSVCFSPSAKDIRKKGKNGTGVKGFLHHADAAIYETVNADGLLHRTVLTEENLHKWIAQGYGEWDVTEKPSDHPIETTGTRVIWVNYGGTKKSKRRKRGGHDPYSPQHDIENLGSCLPPYMAEQVRVIDFGGKAHELQRRETRGKPIRGNTDTNGEYAFNYALDVVSQHDVGIDYLIIAAMGPVCTWVQFADQFRNDGRYTPFFKRINPVLGNPRVSGYIDDPRLNEYASNSRRGFLADLADDHKLMIDFLSNVLKNIVPKVEDAIGLTASEIVTSDVTTHLTEVVRGIHDALGVTPKQSEDIVPVHIGVSPMRAKLNVGGMPCVFEVTNPVPGSRYVWNDEGSGGSLDKHTGPRVTYTPGIESGQFALHLQEEGGDCLHSIPKITLGEWSLSFIYPLVTLHPHERRLIRLVHTEKTSGEFSWNNVDFPGALQETGNDLERVLVTNDELGTFSVTVTDKKDPSKRAECTIVVEKKSEGTGRVPHRSDSHEFEYEGQTFALWPTSIEGEGNEYDASGLGELNSSRCVIHLNFAHPKFKDKPEIVKREVTLQQIAMRVAQRLQNLGHFGGSSFELIRNIDFVYTKLM